MTTFPNSTFSDLCPICDGSGEHADAMCTHCIGAGWLPTTPDPDALWLVSYDDEYGECIRPHTRREWAENDRDELYELNYHPVIITITESQLDRLEAACVRARLDLHRTREMFVPPTGSPICTAPPICPGCRLPYTECDCPF